LLKDWKKSSLDSLATARPSRRGNDSPRKCGQGPLAKACGASLLRGCVIHRNDRWPWKLGLTWWEGLSVYPGLLGFDATKITGLPW